MPVLVGTADAQGRKAKGATAQCNDGTYSKAQSERGACSSHGGIKTWFGAETKSVGTAGRAAPKTPSPARPQDATGRCDDGSYTTAASKQGACSGHGGVSTWYADDRNSTARAPRTSRDDRPSTSSRTANDPRPQRAPADARDATAQCNDGTYSYASQHRGACSNHGGVKTWFK